MDYGSPMLNGRELRVSPGVSYPAYADGCLHEYVMLLFRAGDHATAEKLGMQVARQLETILDYFEKSPAETAYNNRPDLISALNAYMLIAMISSDETLSNPASALAKRTNGRIGYLYKHVFEQKYTELKKLAKAHGETVGKGHYNSMLQALKEHIDAVAMLYGHIPRPAIQMH